MIMQSSGNQTQWQATPEIKNEILKKHLKMLLSNLGFPDAGQVLDNFSEKMLNSTDKNAFSKTALENIEFNLLILIVNNLHCLMNNIHFINIVNIMKSKSVKFSCESVLKLALYCHRIEKVAYIHDEFMNAKNALLTQLNKENITSNELDKIFGYLFMLNLNKYSYLQIAYFSAKNECESLNFNRAVNRYPELYANFVHAHIQAPLCPFYSIQQREMLFNADLLETYLQRDPEEVEKYDMQMASAQEDKKRLLTDIQCPIDHLVTVIDIGPAGGAVFKSVVSAAFHQPTPQMIGYYGVEFDKKELLSLNGLLNTYCYEANTPRNILKFAYFVEGNALNLSSIIHSLNSDNAEKQDQFFSIILSSVIHEIYSYCPYEEPMTHSKEVTTLTETISSQYNPETIYKIYYEGLKVISENPCGGSLNIRDGVMYKEPHEIVTFTLNNDAWIALFIEFINDRKYKHLKEKINVEGIKPGVPIQLEAKYVQEFMLKANWGARSFGNEINEVYCYLTLTDHIRLLNEAAKNLNINISFPVAEEYTQPEYKEHIDNTKITILSGFSKNGLFPPTNMLLKVNVNNNRDQLTEEHVKVQRISYGNI